MAQAAAKHEAEFVEHGLAADFVKQFLSPKLASDPDLVAAWKNVLRNKPIAQSADAAAPTSPPIVSTPTPPVTASSTKAA